MTAPKQSSGVGREVLITALQLVLGLIGGSLLCAAWLIAKPVSIMDAPPPANRVAEDPHEVIYISGRPATRASQGVRQQRAFFNRTPGEIVLAEQDVNRWLSSVYGAQERTFAVKGTGAEWSPRAPTVRLADDELQIGVEIDLERGGEKSVMVAQARGRFVERNGKQVFAPRQVYLGSCPLPWNLGGSLLYGRIASLFAPPENAVAAWKAVSHAAIVKDRLHLHIGEPPAQAPIELTPSPAAEVAPPSSAPETDSAPPASISSEAPTSEQPASPDEAIEPAAEEAPATTASGEETSAEAGASSGTPSGEAAVSPAPEESPATPETPASTEPAAPEASNAVSDDAASSAPAESTPAVPESESTPAEPAATPAPIETVEPAEPATP